MVKRLATSIHDPLDITDSACKNQLVMVSVQYGPFKTYIPIRSTTIGKSRVSGDPITMHTSWRSNSDIASVTRSTSASKLNDLRTHLESANLEESSDDDAQNRGQADDQHALDMPITNADIRDVAQAGPDHVKAGGERMHIDEPNITNDSTTSGNPKTGDQDNPSRTQGEQHEPPTSYIPGLRWNKNHPPELVIGNPTAPVRTQVFGAAADLDPAPEAQRKISKFCTGNGAGSDQFHDEIGTSTVGGCRSPNPVHDWNHDSFVSLH
ncbi:U-box domain-containing protein 18-like [Dorcoceras hygrometricum]|uniref:U-box domain-containing protein 18-like n=1 Tax=Dorcoceras hygrometricum TaxID=472368 RepID=A0A2Z7A8B8_9LAMI|nr:U-box domain-containing protein 18-like [Dorcoceras hygrometricum]